MKFDHCAYRIKEGSLDFIINLFKQLGFKLTARNDKCVFLQQNEDIALQFIESNEKLKQNHKDYTHIAFISETYKEDMKEIVEWIKTQNVEVIKGAWSDKELWIDCPDIFIDFVIEIFHPSAEI